MKSRRLNLSLILALTTPQLFAAPPESMDKLSLMLTDLKLVSSDDLEAATRSLDEGSQDSGSLIETLRGEGKLNDYQSQVILEGNAPSLVLGNYVITGVLGEGGMGVVYRGRNPRLNRDVAIKFLGDQIAKNPQAIARFIQEGMSASQLYHENIVSTLDAGTHDGRPYLVMQLEKGSDLTGVIQRNGALAVGVALDFTLQVARGLEYAHSKSIIHRDIKPSNLFLTEDHVVKILDLGLSKSTLETTATGATLDPSLTRTGAGMGSPGYMPLEQAVNAKDADLRSDIYGLGATLYFLISGRPMYISTSYEDYIRQISANKPPSLEQARPGVPKELNELYLRMVDMDPAKRPQSMKEVIEILNAMPKDLSTPMQAPKRGVLGKVQNFCSTVFLGR